MDGMTGFNPEQAIRDISSTSEWLFSGYREYFDFCKSFINNLGDKWASPKAVEFGEKYMPLIKEAILYMLKVQTSFDKSAREAYNIIARSNGYPLMHVSKEGQEVVNEVASLMDGEFKPFREEYVGTVGMNINQAKEVLNTFISNTSVAIKDFESAPVEVAFFDPSGEMATAFRNEINNIKEKVTSLAESIENEVKGAMEEETNTILLAKQNATDTMSA